MNRRRDPLWVAFLPSAAVLLAAGGFGAGWLSATRSLRSTPAAKFAAALDRIEKAYYGEAPPERLVDAALRGMVEALDPNCAYFTAAEWKEFNETQLVGRFGGVGIVVEADPATGYVTVVTPLEDTPAFREDIRPGDQIREVDGVSLRGLPLHEVIRRIKGPPGTEVRLTIFRKGREPFSVTLRRAMIQVRAVKARMLDGEVGYVRISDFTEMMDQFDAAVGDLRARGMKALVLDLRFNHGGLLEESVKLADRFLDDGTIVTTRGREGEEVREAHPGDTLPPWPLAVLVNETTASASEVFAGAMKDRGRGTIVGTRTFGKGSVQTPFPLPDESRLKITTARYFTPRGVCVHREEGKKEYGIEPDVRVEMTAEEIDRLKAQWNAERIVKGDPPPEADPFVDLQLEAAVEVVRARLEGRAPRVRERILGREGTPGR